MDILSFVASCQHHDIHIDVNANYLRGVIFFLHDLLLVNEFLAILDVDGTRLRLLHSNTHKVEHLA